MLSFQPVDTGRTPVKTPPQKKQAISYVRFSDARQRVGSSVERQEKMIADWLAQHPDYEVSQLRYKDLAKSGFHGEHIDAGGGFGDLLVAVQEGEIRAGDVVLVEAIDRAGRLSPMRMLKQIISPILEAGVSIITLDDNTEYTEASLEGSQIFLLVAKIQAAHGYSKLLSERVSASYESRRKQARENRVTPKRMTPVWLNSDGSVRENVVPWIKTAFELYVSGVGKTTIAKRLRDSGVPELAKTSGFGVGHWLRNQAVIGKWEVLIDTADHHVIDDVYPVIIEPSLFYKAQIQFEMKKTTRPAKTARHFLVGLVKCGTCGKNYIIQNKYGKPHSMRCITRANQQACSNSHNVPKPVLDKIYSYTSVKAALEAIAQQQMGVNDKEIVTREAELHELSKKVASLLQTVDAVGFMPELATKLKEAQKAREAAENALVILRSTVVAPPAQGWNEMGKLWTLEAEDSQRLAAMLRTVGYSITVNADGQITSSHSNGVYRYDGVDRRQDKYKLMAGERLILVSKGNEADYPYHEPFQSDEPAESVWDETDYADLHQQHQ
ncbi:recombinase family protein [Pseudomonas shahriarae]|uniref:recombinase family protein n=1 Tax=Pseudomonas shahriarae TaxID=2745512 RepID=UPI0014733471|nr:MULTISPECIES: recombinase family protein [Pseudomonas]MCU0209592.1 recombinase family protein [Pseudomonas shahriarae]NMY22920.1 recombinase family protein [Pseudomonas sp. WS 5410]